jgi:hypothetical protein
MATAIQFGVAKRTWVDIYSDEIHWLTVADHSIIGERWWDADAGAKGADAVLTADICAARAEAITTRTQITELGVDRLIT